MAHELSIQNGKAEMVSGRGMVPWHKLGTVVSGLMTAREALEAAHLDWTVSGRPVTVAGNTLPFPTKENTVDCWQGICRDDNNECLSIVKGRYTPIQNSEAFTFFDNLVGEGKAVYDTAGALRGGKQVWLLAKVNGEIKINGDAHREYALLLANHVGGIATSIAWVYERVVCANTLAIALNGAQNTVKIRHTKNWRDQEAEARRVLGLGQKYFATIQEALEGMNELLMTPEQMKQFSTLMFPTASDDGKVSPALQNIRDEVTRLFGEGAGNKGASRWDALQAVTDYVDHSRTLRGENSTRLEASLVGRGAAIKQQAFELLVNEDVMGPLLAGTFVPTGRTIDPVFSALLERN